MPAIPPLCHLLTPVLPAIAISDRIERPVLENDSFVPPPVLPPGTVPEGQISKPRGSKEDSSAKGTSGLAGAVFYLPQKPYNVLGTLYDQVSASCSFSQSHAIDNR
eukprot:SAG22_NODE_359_length_11758_cov_4.094254_6_plen_106_part_00